MKQKKKNSLLICMLALTIALSSFFASVPNFAIAQDCKSPAQKSPECGFSQCLLNGKCVLANPASKQLVDLNNFGDLAGRIVQIFLAVAGAVAVVFLMIGGFQYITARGNEEGMEKAKKTLTGAVIGIVIIVMAFAIVAIINNTLVNPPK